MYLGEEIVADQIVNNFENHLFEVLQNYGIGKNFYIAFSGGMDSSVLLDAAHRLREKGKIKSLSAVHVNHKLQQNADQWHSHCQQICQQYQIPFYSTVLKWPDGKTSDSEEMARKGRYDYFIQLMKVNDILLFAHHQDDQAETLLFRLIRGTGIDGAKGMPIYRSLGKGHLLRPFLQLTRDQIETYAKKIKLRWVADPSNNDEKFARNYLRHQIIPKLKSRWPNCQSNLARFTEIATRQSVLLDEIAEQDLQSLKSEKIHCCMESYPAIEIFKLLELTEIRMQNVLHYWGKKYGLAAPGFVEIENLINQLSAAKRQSIQVGFSGKCVRSYKGILYLLENEVISPLRKSEVWSDITKPLELANGMHLHAHQTLAKGIRLPQKDEQVIVSPRKGGERCLPEYRNKTTDLKKIYQELDVPPWLREVLPVIYYNDEIVAVPQVFTSKPFINTNEQKQSSILFGLR